MLEISHKDTVQLIYDADLYTTTKWYGEQIQKINKHDFIEELMSEYPTSWTKAEEFYGLACACNEWIHAHNSLAKNSLNYPIGISTLDSYFNRTQMLRESAKAIDKMNTRLNELGSDICGGKI